jgi:hypothetical protein
MTKIQLSSLYGKLGDMHPRNLYPSVIRMATIDKLSPVDGKQQIIGHLWDHYEPLPIPRQNGKPIFYDVMSRYTAMKFESLVETISNILFGKHNKGKGIPSIEDAFIEKMESPARNVAASIPVTPVYETWSWDFVETVPDEIPELPWRRDSLFREYAEKDIEFTQLQEKVISEMNKDEIKLALNSGMTFGNRTGKMSNTLNVIHDLMRRK